MRKAGKNKTSGKALRADIADLVDKAAVALIAAYPGEENYSKRGSASRSFLAIFRELSSLENDVYNYQLRAELRAIQNLCRELDEKLAAPALGKAGIDGYENYARASTDIISFSFYLDQIKSQQKEGLSYKLDRILIQLENIENRLMDNRRRARKALERIKIALIIAALLCVIAGGSAQVYSARKQTRFVESVDANAAVLDNGKNLAVPDGVMPRDALTYKAPLLGRSKIFSLIGERADKEGGTYTLRVGAARTAALRAERFDFSSIEEAEAQLAKYIELYLLKKLSFDEQLKLLSQDPGAISKLIDRVVTQEERREATEEILENVARLQEEQFYDRVDTGISNRAYGLADRITKVIKAR